MAPAVKHNHSTQMTKRGKTNMSHRVNVFRHNMKKHCKAGKKPAAREKKKKVVVTTTEPTQRVEREQKRRTRRCTGKKRENTGKNSVKPPQRTKCSIPEPTPWPVPQPGTTRMATTLKHCFAFQVNCGTSSNQAPHDEDRILINVSKEKNVSTIARTTLPVLLPLPI